MKSNKNIKNNLKYIKNKPFNPLNDYFIRYLFTEKGKSENILLDFINSIMLNANMKTFSSVEILTPFNLKKNKLDKETIVDVKCVTKNGIVVIIEIQLQGNARFSERILYYWAVNYSKLLKKGEKYDELTPVISINLLNFNLSDDDIIHSCYMIYESINRRLFTDHLQIHTIELKKFKHDILRKDLNCWLKLLTSKNVGGIMSEIVKEKPIMEEVREKYNNFIKDRMMMMKYEKKEAYAYGNQIMLEEERRLGIEEGLKKGIKQGIEEGIMQGIEKGIMQGIEKGREEGITQGIEKGREEGIKEGIKEGIEQGIKSNQISIAKSMKDKSMDINLISELTGLSVEEIEDL